VSRAHHPGAGHDPRTGHLRADDRIRIFHQERERRHINIADHHGNTLTTGRTALDGVTLHHHSGGSGPAVVLLHGIPKTGLHWRLLVPWLTPHHTVVVPDLRGFGDSSHPEDGYDVATLADDIAALMAELGHDQYAVVGEDWGAVVGYQLAARHRDQVTGLVFVEALMPGFGFEHHTLLSPANVKGLYLPHVGLYFADGLPELLIAGHEAELVTATIVGERTVPGTATQEAIDEYVRCYSQPDGIRSMLAVYRAMLVDAELNRRAQEIPLEVPVLALGGSAFIAERNEEVMRLFAKDVTGHVFECGHDPAEEVPDEMAPLVLEFLAGLGS
jgi:pimeloyl-ACP methyl ester carboxylesterase